MTIAINQKEKSLNKKSSINLSEIFKGLSTRKMVAKLFIPVAIQLFLFMLLGMVHSIIISIFVENGAAIVGLGDVTLNVFNSFALIVSAGLTVTYTWALAQNQHEKAKSILNNGFKLMIILSILVILLSSTLGLLMIDFQARPDQSKRVVNNAKIFLILKSLTWPFISIHDHIIRIFRVEGKIKKSAFIGILPIILLIFFDLLLVVFANGSLNIFGPCLAFVLAYASTLIIIVPYIFGLKKLDKTDMFPSLSTSKLNWTESKSLLKFGFPVFWRRLIFILVFVFSTALINEVTLPPGETNPEYWTIILGPGIKLLDLLLSMSLAANQGCTALLAYLHKKKEKEKTKEVLLWMWIYTTVTTLMIFAIIAISRIPLLSLYGINPSTSQQLIFLIIVGIGIPYPIQIVSFSYFLNSGGVKETFITTSIKGLVLYPIIAIPTFLVFKDYPEFTIVFILIELLYAIFVALFLGYHLSSEKFKDKLKSPFKKSLKEK